MSKLREFWGGLWRPQGAPAPDLGGSLWSLDSLSTFPTLASVTALVLWNIVRAVACNKAPGADGWRYAELKDWSWDLFELYAAVLRLVEAEGRWPGSIQPNVVCMLPKGGTHAPDDRRPIVLLSVLCGASGGRPRALAPAQWRPVAGRGVRA